MVKGPFEHKTNAACAKPSGGHERDLFVPPAPVTPVPLNTPDAADKKTGEGSCVAVDIQKKSLYILTSHSPTLFRI